MKGPAKQQRAFCEGGVTASQRTGGFFGVRKASLRSLRRGNVSVLKILLKQEWPGKVSAPTPPARCHTPEFMPATLSHHLKGPGECHSKRN